jgi:hypothetical protein
MALSAARCGDPAEPADNCTGAEICGTPSDCPALCAVVARLGCGAAWGIDGADGECLSLCENASPGLCPRLAAQQSTCEALDRATECGR